MHSFRKWIVGFWEYVWKYPEAHLSVYRTATAMAAAFGLLMYFDPLFALPAIAAYLLPPMYLYHVEDNPDSADILETDEDSRRETDTDTDFDGIDADADADGTDTDFDGRDADFDGPDIDADGDDFDGSDGDADADGADADADGADADADGADVDIDN